MASHFVNQLLREPVGNLMSSRAMKTRILRYAPLLLWMGVISFASTSEFSAANTSRFIRPLLLWLFPQVSEEKIALIHFLVRKAAHFSEYAILGFLAARAFINSSQRLLQLHWFKAGLILVISYALLDELHQAFASSRTGSIYDSLIDIAGGLFALICFALFNKRGRAIQPPLKSRS